MQAVIGGCRSCPFPCPGPGKKAAAAEARREQLDYASFLGSSSMTRSIAAPTGALNCGCRAPASRRPAAWRTSTGRRPSPSTAGSWTPSSKHEHVLLVGPAGVGKSFMAQALGFTAIRAGYEVSGPTCAFVLQASRVDPDWPPHIHPMGQGNAVYLALPGSFIPNPSRSVQNQAEWDMLLQLAADHQERTGIPPSGDIITLSPPHLQAEDEDQRP